MYYLKKNAGFFSSEYIKEIAEFVRVNVILVTKNITSVILKNNIVKNLESNSVTENIFKGVKKHNEKKYSYIFKFNS